MKTRRGFLADLVAAGTGLQQASELIRRKSASPVELTEDCLKRIDKLNPVLNAFITVTGDQALAQARELEAERQRGKYRGPLHGVPIALKDLIDTAGVRTTAASAVFADRIPTEDAEVVRRLKAAGAVLLGKLNMHEFAYGASSVPSHYGPVHNPWKLDRIAGGSSGGSGAAVAAGLCYGALGSDTGGSIRQPSAYCGIAGLKPTYGRVSTRGVIPLSWSLDHIGPMCRTVADAALLLEAIAGYDARDTNSVNVPVADYSRAVHSRIAAMRIGIPHTPFYQDLDAEIDAAVRDAIGWFDKVTAGSREVQLPAYGALPITSAEAYTYHLPYLSKTPELYQPSTRQRLERGAAVTAGQYIRARRELDRLRRDVSEVFKSVDVLVTPTTPILPIPIEGAERDVPAVGGVSLSLRNTVPFDLFGLPAISIPCGFSKSGLPIGLQISGPPWGEMQVLGLAHAYEQATEWHKRRPDLS